MVFYFKEWFLREVGEQDKKETAAVGMIDNMVTVPELEKILLDLFKEVWQYWDSGNFKGYCASDDPSKVHRFSKYSTVKTPKKVEPMSESLKTFDEWLTEHLGRSDKLTDLVTKEIENFRRMSHGHARKHHGPTIVAKAASQGIHMTPEDLEKFLTQALGVEVHVPKFDRATYDHHL